MAAHLGFEQNHQYSTLAEFVDVAAQRRAPVIHVCRDNSNYGYTASCGERSTTRHILQEFLGYAVAKNPVDLADGAHRDRRMDNEKYTLGRLL